MDRRLKIVLLGPTGSGKSRALGRWTGGRREHPTLGVNVSRVDRAGARLTVWDEAGDPRFQLWHELHLQGADGFLLFGATPDVLPRGVPAVPVNGNPDLALDALLAQLGA